MCGPQIQDPWYRTQVDSGNYVGDSGRMKEQHTPYSLSDKSCARDSAKSEVTHPPSNASVACNIFFTPADRPASLSFIS